MVECVFESIKAHIANVASLELLIDNLDAERVGRDLATALNTQLEENEERLKKSLHLEADCMKV